MVTTPDDRATTALTDGATLVATGEPVAAALAAVLSVGEADGAAAVRTTAVRGRGLEERWAGLREGDSAMR